jgi:arylsulfatase A-like enzyme
VLALSAACGGGAHESRPNVLLLVMNTTRGDRCSVGGYARPTTPRLDAFAKDAVTFRDAWAPCCRTGPSHATIFTGLSPLHHGLTDSIRAFLREDATTLAESLRDAGWRTACFSNNDLVSRDFGMMQGFQTVDALYETKDRPYPPAPDTHRRALAWVNSSDGDVRPFFLVIHDIEPHLPYEPPPAVAARFLPADASAAEVADARAFTFPWSTGYSLGLADVPPRKLALLSDLYDAEIATLDDAIGALLGGLESAELLDRTVVVVCGDHGENLGEGHRLGHLLSLRRSTLHVPLVVRVPGKMTGGRAVDDPVRLEDVAPTILEACGLPVPADLDGRSLAGDVRGRVAQAVLDPQRGNLDALAKAFPGGDLSRFHVGLVSAYDGRFHLVHGSDGRDELYDVKSDPGEARDLASASPDELARMRKLLPK